MVLGKVADAGKPGSETDRGLQRAQNNQDEIDVGTDSSPSSTLQVDDADR